jgi:hypothetical protein
VFFVTVSSTVRLCADKDRAEIAHYFYHWRYHLREQVKNALTEIGRYNQNYKDHIRRLSAEMQDAYVCPPYVMVAECSALEQVMDSLDRERHIANVLPRLLWIAGLIVAVQRASEYD